MPRMEFLNVEKMQYIQRAVISDKDDPEDTVPYAMTHKEVAVFIGGLCLMDIMFPEFERYTGRMRTKLADLTKHRDFFETRFETLPEGEELDADGTSD